VADHLVRALRLNPVLLVNNGLPCCRLHHVRLLREVALVPAKDLQADNNVMILVPKIGIVVVAVLGVGSIFGLAILDAVFGGRDQATIGDRIVTWTKKNPWFAAASSFILGVLISHFFWPGNSQ